MLEKLKTEQLIEKPYARKVIPFRFPETERSGREVITIEGLTHGYGDKVGSPLTCVSGRMRLRRLKGAHNGGRSPVKGPQMGSRHDLQERAGGTAFGS
jgi:ATPase subunit of ABC transporter with duplicated ATPase domains